MGGITELEGKKGKKLKEIMTADGGRWKGVCSAFSHYPIFTSSRPRHRHCTRPSGAPGRASHISPLKLGAHIYGLVK